MTYEARFFCACGFEQTNRMGPLSVTGIEKWQVGVTVLPPQCPTCGKTMARHDPRDEGSDDL